MTTIIIIVLFIAQLLSFYFLLILNSKISKFKSLEKNQAKLISEMEDTFSVYLLDMKEENDRLIREMAKVKQTDPNTSIHITKNEQTPVYNNTELKDQHLGDINIVQESNDIFNKQVEPMKVTPKSVAANAYKKNTTPSYQENTKEVSLKPVDEVLQTFESEVLQYYKNGMSIEEIAKKTQKGKTEIELLIKFHV